MQMVESRLRMKKKSQKMTVEKYVDFIDSKKQFDLTIPNLNEIISIHGFKKSKRQKKVLADAVNTMELIDLRRSTLQEEISSEAFVTLDEAIKDLTNLNWQECCVTSLQTICFSTGVNGSDHCQAKTNATASSIPNIPPPTKKPKIHRRAIIFVSFSELWYGRRNREEYISNNWFYYGTAHDVHVDLLCTSLSSTG